VGVSFCERCVDQRCDLACQERWDCISNLDVLLCPVAEEQVVVREGLQPGGLADCQAATLRRVWMDEVVPVFGDVACHGSCSFMGQLNPETVAEDTAVPVLVIGAERRGKICGLRTVLALFTKDRREKVAT
jgi:hypothetical protein